MGSVVYTIDIVRPVEKTIGLTQYISKYLEHFSFKKEINREVQLAFLSSKVLNRDNLISSVKLSPESRRLQVPKKVSGNTFFTSSKEIEITNIAINESMKVTPLFYSMNVTDYLSVDLSGLNARVLYDQSTSTLYCDKESEYNPFTEEFKSIKILTSSGFKLFNGSSLFREATIEDVDPDTLTFYRDRLLYTMEYIPAIRQYKFTVLNASGPFYYRERTKSGVYLQRDGLKDLAEPWFPEYSIGQVKHLGSLYSPGNFEDQPFFPYYPFLTQKERAKLIDVNTIKLDRDNLTIDDIRGLFIEIVVFNNLGELKFCFTNGPKVNTLYNRSSDVRWQLLDYQYDGSNSVVRVLNPTRLLSSDYIEVTYPYKSYSIKVRSLNLNPKFNKRIYNHNYITYIGPSSSGVSIEWFEFCLIEGTYIVTRVSDSTRSEFIGSALGFDFETFSFSGLKSDLYPLNIFQYNPQEKNVDIYLQDVRLEGKIDKGKELEVLKKYPHIWQTKEYSDRFIEFSDKYFHVCSVDPSGVYQVEKEYKNTIQKSLPVGSGIFLEEGGIIPRVKEMYSIENDILNVKLFKERPGSISKVYKCTTLNQKSEEDETVGTETWITYDTDLEILGIDVSGIEENICSFYVEVEYNGYETRSGTIYTLRIRDEE
jgi:hypothetical protein